MYTIDIRHKDIGLVSYRVYRKEEADKEKINYKYWKEAKEGDYAVSDDEYVSQVIKKK